MAKKPSKVQKIEPSPISEPIKETIIENPVIESTPVVKEPHSIYMFGVWAYIIGIIIALATALLYYENGLSTMAMATLTLIGVIVGILNITKEESNKFLIASIAFLVSASSVRGILVNGIYGASIILTFLEAFILFTAGSAIVVSLQLLFQLAHKK